LNRRTPGLPLPRLAASPSGSSAEEERARMAGASCPCASRARPCACAPRAYWCCWPGRENSGHRGRM